MLLQYIKYFILEFIPSTALFHPPPLTLGTVSIGIIFAFTYMDIHDLYHIHPPTPFSVTASLLPVPNPPHQPLSRTCSALLFSDFVVEKA
jgi:hypothetical protein